jgi:hypothetical protein
MRHLLAAAALTTAALASPVVRAADVGISVQISQPGVYGRIDIGRYPQPQVVVAQPMIISRPVQVQQAPEPVYMWVPEGHRKNWKKHCGHYNACGVPVYFVHDDWYGEHVHPEGKGHKGKDYHGPDEHGKGKHD